MAVPHIVFDHIAIATERMADAPEVLVGTLGGAPDAGGTSDVFNWGCWRFSGGGRIEVIEPRGPNGFVHRFLAAHGPGIHHVTFRVPSLRETCDRAEAGGYQVVGYDDSDPHWRVAYLHPKQALGIVVQIAQPGGRGTPRRWQPPPGPTTPPPPVTILGLRMRAHSAPRARTQWESILQGQLSAGPAGELVFRWPGSPMGIVVEIDPSSEEAPLAIDITTDRPIALATGRLPRLGAVVVEWATPSDGGWT